MNSLNDPEAPKLEKEFDALLKQRSLEPMDDALAQRIIDAAEVRKTMNYAEPWWRSWLMSPSFYAVFASLVVVAMVAIISFPDPIGPAMTEAPHAFEISDAQILEEVFYYPDEAFF